MKRNKTQRYDGNSGFRLGASRKGSNMYLGGGLVIVPGDITTSSPGAAQKSNRKDAYASPLSYNQLQ